MKSEETIEVEIIIRKKGETITLNLPVCYPDYTLEPEWEDDDWYDLGTRRPLIFKTRPSKLDGILFKVKPVADKETHQYGTYKVKRT